MAQFTNEQIAEIERRIQVFQLTRQTEEALTKLDQSLLGIDVKLVNAAEECKTGAVGEIEVLRSQMYTYSVGAKAEITEIVAAIKSGKGTDAKGGKGFGCDMGKGFDTGFGKGADRKEVAVWKLPDDVSKTQFRHWMNAVDLQLEAVHGWRHADLILNRVKRSEDPIDAEVFERCLHEAGLEIDVIEGEGDGWSPPSSTSTYSPTGASFRTHIWSTNFIETCTVESSASRERTGSRRTGRSLRSWTPCRRRLRSLWTPSYSIWPFYTGQKYATFDGCTGSDCCSRK
jgi:hypothetical protein